MTEDQLEREALGWLQDVGYAHQYGPDIAHDGPAPARANYQHVHLPLRLRQAVDTLLPRVISGQLRLPEAETMLEKTCA